MRIAYFDCFNGVAGDMMVGALIDAGCPPDELMAALKGLPISGYEMSFARARIQGLSATRFKVLLDSDAPQPHRHLKDVLGIIEAGNLPANVRGRAGDVFSRLAEAEASVHGTTVERVHFHEVGAVDAVIDIVGACWALERLGVERVVCSPVPVGSGTVKCEHGLMPVPAPATAKLLADVPIAATTETGELTTPTGAALVTAWADSFGGVPAMTLRGIGYGAGSREGVTRPNFFRVLLGDSAASDSSDVVVVLEANLDDATPETVGYAMERLLEAGALDVYCLPIHMKKSRPGMLLTALAVPDGVSELESVLFAETTTFGVRRYEVLRSKLGRRVESVPTRFGPIRVKIGLRAGQVVTVAAEYEDSRNAAREHGVPLRTVMSEAVERWKQTAGDY